MHIVPYTSHYEAAILALSLRAWTPVFEQFEQAMPAYVFGAFYPDGWQARQAADIGNFLQGEGSGVFVALDDEVVAGWIGIRLHPEDRMGEIYILAVDPDHQRRGVAALLINHAFARMEEAGMQMAMVETGDDPGHAPSRATYEGAGFERWPLARYFRQLKPNG